MKHIFLSILIVILSSIVAQANILDDIKERGYIKVGVSLGGMPMGGRDGRNNPVGYDVDVANRVADALGVELRIIDVYGDARVSMLVSKQLDMVIGNMTITDARAKIVDFSDAYFRTGLKIAVQRGSGINSLEGLRGKRIVVGRGTSGAVFLQQQVPEAEIVYADNFAPNGILLLRQRRVDAGIEDGSLIDFLVRDINSLEAMPQEFLSGDIGMGISKGEPELLDWVNQHIADYVGSGDFELYYHKWWGDDAVAPDLSTK